jgi:hypothetical protein
LRCLPYVHLPTDAPWWVAKSAFIAHFDQQDFMCRQVASVVDAYLEEWFHDGPAGTRYFKIPPVSVINGKTQFISGRHRTAVLLRHLECIPLSFHMREISDADTDWIRRIALSPIETDIPFELPDLPIRPTLP